MSNKKLGFPQIEDYATAFAYSHCELPKHIEIFSCIEMAKALRHNDRNIESSRLWAIIANIDVFVRWSGTQRPRLCDYISISFNADN